MHELLAPSLPGLATLLARVPTMVTFHATRAPTPERWVFRHVTRWFRPLASRVTEAVAVSPSAARCAEPLMGRRVEVVPNGIDPTPFVRARPLSLPPGRTLLFVSRLDRRKGLGVLLRAFARLAARHRDLQLVICGDGPCRSEVEGLPGPLRRRVIMLGAVSDAVLPSVYAAADVFVAPATGRESFGVILLEAMAAGRPVVASDLPGYREVLRDGEDAMLVPAGDPASLARAVSVVLDSPGRASELARRGRARVRSFDWEVVASRLEALYAQARLDRRSGRDRLGDVIVEPSRQSRPREVVMDARGAGRPESSSLRA